MRHALRSVLLLAGGLVLGLPCWSQAQPVPRVTITQPTTAPTFTTALTTIPVGGTARALGNRTLRGVTWQTNTGLTGAATGTTAWSFPLTLAVGITQVTVTAEDTQGRRGTDVLTVTVQGPPPLPGAITLLWDYSGGGEAFQIERCTETTPTACTTMVPIASIAIADRSWVDENVAPELDYCYRLAAIAGGQRGPYSEIVCSP